MAYLALPELFQNCRRCLRRFWSRRYRPLRPRPSLRPSLASGLLLAGQQSVVAVDYVRTMKERMGVPTFLPRETFRTKVCWNHVDEELPIGNDCRYLKSEVPTRCGQPLSNQHDARA